ncbi:FAD-binding oxidoreductase [Actinoplanes bogorensis]|uniref:D-amino-acid oxidase n=1 Tax=Paractinoplanes bogorensis TaxID=1610840 RepID=A0ABS5Z0Z3_9ACTN|nr:FAD-dependent oxidoreductase [Actinoplanes bogorensis]MBU2669358.1 FAD-binding oxidoreductase [Actinoplanes bogorensis]
MKPDVLVAGAGVSGLTSGIRLAEAGFQVRIVAAEMPLDTTSAAAGAIWGPAYVDHPEVPRWGDEGLRIFTDLAGDAGAGVRMLTGVEASRVPTSAAPWVHGATAAGPGDLPDGWASGWRFRAPVIDMPVYLQWLLKRYEATGGELIRGRLTRLEDGLADAPVVVNCTGLGARALTGDDTLAASRGQIVVVANPGVEEFFVEMTDDPELAYLLPQGDRLLLGGCTIAGDESPGIDPLMARRIIDRCAAVRPEVRDAEVLGHRVGFRPIRPTVRLERDGSIIHNYGHGGAGITLSWGCATDVVALAREIAQDR